MAVFEPNILGIFIFGLFAGICPCNSVLCLGLIGYLTGVDSKRSLMSTLKLTVPFSIGTIIALLPLGMIAGLIGDHLLFINETIAWAIGGIIMILMGLQLLKIYKPPIRNIFNFFRGSQANTATGTFLLGLSFGAITIGRAAPMLLVVLTYIGLYQDSLSGLVTMLIYSVGLSVPLLIISSIGGTIGSKIKSISSKSGEFIDKVIGCLIVLIGIYFTYLAFA